MRRMISILATAMLMAFALQLSGGAPAARAQGGGGHVHTVQMGETLYSIAMRHGIDPIALAAANGLANPDYIYAGQVLRLPGSYMPDHDGGGDHGGPPQGGHGGGGTYTVRLGDSLYGIAMQFGTTVSMLVEMNNLPNANYIFAGQVLTVPGGGPNGGHAGPGGGYGKPVGDDGPGWAGSKCGFYYHVRPGDTLSGIAWEHGTTIYALARANGVMYPYLIYVGQGLQIPCAKGTPAYVDYEPPRYYPKPVDRYPGQHGQPPKPRPRATAAPKLSAARCAAEVNIAQPLQHQTLNGLVWIIGTANIADFQFYKLEYARGTAPLDSSFASIDDVHKRAVSGSVLGTWYVANMPEGDYTLRLTAVDVRGQFPRPCNVNVRIKH